MEKVITTLEVFGTGKTEAPFTTGSNVVSDDFLKGIVVDHNLEINYFVWKSGIYSVMVTDDEISISHTGRRVQTFDGQGIGSEATTFGYLDLEKTFIDLTTSLQRVLPNHKIKPEI